MTSMCGGAYQYDFTDTITGRYDITGISDGCEKTFATYFTITYSGLKIGESQTLFYIPLFLVFFFLFFIILFGINHLPDSNATDPEDKIIKISYLKYLRCSLWFVLWSFIVGILFISSNLAFAYLPDTLIADFFFMLFKITFGLTLPIIVIWFLWILAKITEDKQLNNMMKRGMFQQNL